MYWDRENLVWAAGLFEGEGCISLRHQGRSGGRDQWRLTMGMTDEDVITKFHHIVKCGSVNLYVDKRPQSKKPMYCWGTYTRRDVYALLAAFYPFLGLRRQTKAQEALISLPSVNSLRQYTCLKCGKPQKGHSRLPRKGGGRGAGNWVCPANEELGQA